MLKFLIAISLILISIFLIIQPKWMPFKKTRGFGLIVLCSGFVLLFISSILVIPAGNTGVAIFFGKVSPKPLKSGVNLIPPYASIVTYSTRLQEITLEKENLIEARVLNGLIIKMDSTTLYRINEEKAPEIYSLYATNIDDLKGKILIPIIRTEIRNIVSKYTAEEVYSIKREQISKEIENSLRENLSLAGVIVEKFLIRGIFLPPDLDEAIQAKLKAQQEAEAMVYKKQKAEEEARIRIIEAKGLSEAQRIINSTLTPYYLQLEAIRMYKELANSSNTTFILVPTSPNATGIPLIINGVR